MVSPQAARSDLAVGLSIALLSAIIYWAALGLPPPIYDPIGAGGIVKAVAAVLFGMAVALTVWSLRQMSSAVGSATSNSNDVPAESPLWSVLPFVALLFAYVAAMQWQVLRFQEATVMLILAYSGLMRRPTLKQILLLIPLSLLIGYGGFWLFSRIFLVRLPG